MQTGEPQPSTVVIPAANTTHSGALPQTYSLQAGTSGLKDSTPHQTTDPDTYAELGYDATIAPVNVH